MREVKREDLHYCGMFFMVLLLSSCSFKEIIEFRKRLMQTEVESVDFECKNKTVHYIDMIHMGQQEFYDNVRSEIKEYKQNDYVLFYEWIDYDNADEITLKKTKKIVGLVPSSKGYRKVLDQIDVEGVVVQDNDLFLGLENELDYNMDITPDEVIESYEKRFGTIQLSEEEMKGSLDNVKPMKGVENQVRSIILDYRNQYLATKIQESGYQKIIVIYGADHQKGLLEELQKLDADWIIAENS